MVFHLGGSQAVKALLHPVGEDADNAQDLRPGLPIATADDIMENPAKYENACAGKILATLFFEPSTRPPSPPLIIGTRE